MLLGRFFGRWAYILRREKSGFPTGFRGPRNRGPEDRMRRISQAMAKPFWDQGLHQKIGAHKSNRFDRRRGRWSRSSDPKIKERKGAFPTLPANGILKPGPLSSLREAGGIRGNGASPRPSRERRRRSCLILVKSGRRRLPISPPFPVHGATNPLDKAMNKPSSREGSTKRAQSLRQDSCFFPSRSHRCRFPPGGGNLFFASHRWQFLKCRLSDRQAVLRRFQLTSIIL